MLEELSNRPSTLKLFQSSGKETEVYRSSGLGPVTLPVCGVNGSRGPDGYCGLAKGGRLAMFLPRDCILLTAYCKGKAVLSLLCWENRVH
ncbi:hypothetical protein Baya_8854 [Bagarius yarrelli]|uniref:Uncharacterized protein n=1 Tax=Bagarius yarrelli TaxID=175774 RepID=A0A556U9A6_BAGYA|nr:hypothetical protein Baya_8854 [Bagarius yarrelli]